MSLLDGRGREGLGKDLVEDNNARPYPDLEATAPVEITQRRVGQEEHSVAERLDTRLKAVGDGSNVGARNASSIDHAGGCLSRLAARRRRACAEHHWHAATDGRFRWCRHRFSWGHGTLTYQGKQFRVKVEGLSVGEVGVTQASAK